MKITEELMLKEERGNTKNSWRVYIAGKKKVKIA
jgi:hypothetical protein